MAADVAQRFDAGVILVHTAEPARYTTGMVSVEDPHAVEMLMGHARRLDRSNTTRGRKYIAAIPRDRITRQRGPGQRSSHARER